MNLMAQDTDTSIMFNPTQTTTKLPANETKLKTAVVTTSDATIDMNAVTPSETKGRVSGEERKQEEEVRTVFDDMKEEVRDEEEIGWEEDTKM